MHGTSPRHGEHNNVGNEVGAGAQMKKKERRRKKNFICSSTPLVLLPCRPDSDSNINNYYRKGLWCIKLGEFENDKEGQ